MAKDILSQIESRMDGFSKGQKRIARYIIEEPDKAAFMTAQKLGATVGTSESTVVRFAYENGFDGYPGLQNALQEMIRNKMTVVQRMELLEDGGEDLLGRVMSLDIDRIKRTLDGVDREAFSASVSALNRARYIYIVGVRTSSVLANFLGFYLNLIFGNTRMVLADGSGEIFEQILHIDKGDVLVAISFPRYSRRTAQAVRYAADRGADIIAITDSKSAPIAQFGGHLLLAHSDMASFVDSLVPPLSLINALIVAVGLSRRSEISKTFDRLEEIWETFGVFEKLEDHKLERFRVPHEE